MKLGAVDIGSNAIRLLISRVIPIDSNNIQFKKVEFIRIPLRLGDDVFSGGKIGKEKQELFLMTINAFKLILDIHKVKYYRACATSAMREAKNGRELVEKAHKKFGLKVEIISGELESELIHKSVVYDSPQTGNYLNVDVGGGSTEITIIRDHKVVNSQSFPIGSVRLKEGKVTAEVWEEMQAWVQKHIEPGSHSIAIGTGGNINKLYEMVAGKSNEPISYSQLENLYNEIAALSITDRIYKLKLNPDRADVIDHAARIYLSIMKWAEINKIYSPNAGLKDGLILELWEKYKNVAL